MTSSLSCSISSCTENIVVMCICCQDHYCSDHLNKHAELMNNDLTVIANEINELFDELSSVSSLQCLFFEQLHRWLVNAHRSIDEFHEKRTREVDETISKPQNKQMFKVIQLRDEVNRMIQNRQLTKQQIISINESIRSLKEQINQNQFFEFFLPSIIINDPADLRPNRSITMNLLFLSSSPPQKTIELNEHLFVIGAEEESLLLAHYDKLCLLNRQLIVTKQIPWINTNLYDMFWCNVLGRYLLITSQEILILDSNRMSMEKLSLEPNAIISDWFCGTCLSDKLFLSTRVRGSSIYEYSLLPSIEFVRTYDSPSSCKKDESIMDLTSNNHTLIIILTRNFQNQVRLDLCSSTTFERYWSNEVGILSGRYRIRCCSLDNDRWMVINRNKSQFFYISSNGNVVQNKTYNPSPCHAVTLERNTLAVLTIESLNLHHLS